METGFPTRYVLAILGFLGFVMVYAMRVNLSVAIVAMVNSSASIGVKNSSNAMACQELYVELQNGTSHSKLEPIAEFNWNPNIQSTVLGAFFYGYVATQIPGGIAAEKWNAKWLFGLGVFITALLTLLSPLAARWRVEAFIAIRIVEGLAEGAMFPSINTMIGRWVPKMERSRISTFIFSGMFVGNVVALPVSGFLSESNIFGGWPSAFYIFGLFGCLWFIFWAYLIHERPEDHPRITPSELFHIKEEHEGKMHTTIPWKSILTSVRVWALAVTYFGQDWGFYTMMTEIPTYLSNILHFNIKQNGILSSLPYILQTVISWIASYFADKMRQSGRFSITTIRKIFNSIGFFGSGVCILLVAFVGCKPTISVVLLCSALGFNGIGYSGYKVTHVDMNPGLAGILMGITSCIGNMAGFLAPYAVGKFTTSGETLHNWGIVFGVTAGIFFVSAIIYDVFCSAELQSWGAAPSNVTSTDSMKKTPSQTEMSKIRT